MRRKSNIEIHVNVYGRSHSLRADVVHHSPSGLNVALINAHGHPDVPKMQMLMRNTGLARFTRVNRIATRFEEYNTAENYTSLLFSMRSLAWTMDMVDKCTSHLITVKIPDELLEGEGAELDEDEYWRRVGVVASGKFGFCREEEMRPLGDLSPVALKALPGSRNKQKTIQVMVWKTPAYDDGRIQINKQRYLQAGFVNSCFLVNNKVRSGMIPSNNIRGFVGVMPDTNPDVVDQYFRSKYFVRSEGMTDRDVWVLMQCVFNRRRSTPFLCDQSIDHKNANEDIVFVGMTDQEARKCFRRAMGEDTPADPPCMHYTFEDIMSSHDKFVTTHRVYDDAAVARQMFDSYVVQPACSTVESHIYFNVEWLTDLPALGMRRSCIGELLGGQGAMISPQNFEAFQAMTGLSRVQLGISFVHNHLWMWGEYLAVSQRALWEEAVIDLVAGKAHEIVVNEWQATVISAMLGNMQPAVPFYGVGTRFKYSFESCFNARTITVENVDHGQELGMTAVRTVAGGVNTLTFKYTVPPANASVILGLAGSLAIQTPYAHSFTVTNPVKKLSRRSVIGRTDRYNVWALGVAARWNGYDVRYADGSFSERENYLVMCAQNSDMIAMPPVFDSDVDWFNGHTLFGVYEREHVFGDSPTDTLVEGGRREFVWNNDQIALHETFDRRGMETSQLNTRGRKTVALTERVRIDREYLVAVNSEYRPEEADFRVVPVRAGQVPDQGCHVRRLPTDVKM